MNHLPKLPSQAGFFDTLYRAVWLVTLSVLLVLYAFFATTRAEAQTAVNVQRQDVGALRAQVEQFLITQTLGLPGEVAVSVNAIDSRLNLAACAAPEIFMPPAARAWGKTTVGIRCNTSANWTVYVQANVKVSGDYVVSAVPLAQGQAISASDLTRARGDLTALPPGIVTDPALAIGRTLSMALSSGLPLRLDALRTQAVVVQGQSVRVVSSGPGFSVAAEGHALGNAMDGQIVQARIASGQVVSGVAKAGGLVEVTN